MLAASGIVEQFFQDMPEVVEEIRRTFAKMWGLEKEDTETESVVKARKVF